MRNGRRRKALTTAELLSRLDEEVADAADGHPLAQYLFRDVACIAKVAVALPVGIDVAVGRLFHRPISRRIIMSLRLQAIGVFPLAAFVVAIHLVAGFEAVAQDIAEASIIGVLLVLLLVHVLVLVLVLVLVIAVGILIFVAIVQVIAIIILAVSIIVIVIVVVVVFIVVLHSIYALGQAVFVVHAHLGGAAVNGASIRRCGGGGGSAGNGR